MGFPKQEYWSGLPFPFPGDRPDRGIEAVSPVFAGRFFTKSHQGSPNSALFIYFWLCWVLVAAHRLPVVAERGYSPVAAMGFSFQRPLPSWSTGSRHTSFSCCSMSALEHGFHSCSSPASLLCGMWNPPSPGIEPGSLHW